MELSPASARSEWKVGKFREVYYLVGEDTAAKAEAAQALKAALKPDAFNLNEFSEAAPDPQDVISAALTPPMFADRRLVVVKSVKLGAEAKRTIAEYLSDPLPSTTLILFSDDRKPDFRDALCGAAAARQGIVHFKTLKDEEAERLAAELAREAGSTLDREAAKLLIEESGTDTGILKAEMAKILLFTRGRKTIGRDDVLACLGYKKEANPFDFPRILQTRDRAKTLAELERLFADDEDPLALLYKVSHSLNRQLKAKRLKAAGKSENEIFGALRLQPFYDRDYMKWANAVPETTLIAGLKACLELEARLKSETWLDGRVELERLAAAICKAPEKG
ncbi:MAG: DNA polymerase III subunit delta [Elusimicrobia bacterium]|nr:DNA polymerase III subunit delta [Elusimicrobiota bacterium]